MAVVKFNRKIAIVQTAVASKRAAQELAAHILANHLGACIQIAPIRSLYRWRGKTESAGEYLVTVKTAARTADKCAAFIKINHSYELPEIIITGAVADPAYARWVARETSNNKGG